MNQRRTFQPSRPPSSVVQTRDRLMGTGFDIRRRQSELADSPNPTRPGRSQVRRRSGPPAHRPDRVAPNQHPPSACLPRTAAPSPGCARRVPQSAHQFGRFFQRARCLSSRPPCRICAYARRSAPLAERGIYPITTIGRGVGQNSFRPTRARLALTTARWPSGGLLCPWYGVCTEVSRATAQCEPPSCHRAPRARHR